MKKIILSILLTIICFAFTGCGANEINIEELNSKLLSEGSFSEELFSISADVAMKRYGIEDGEVEECISSAGTAAVVDEITIFKTTNTDAVKEKAQKHIDSQKNSYSSYRPDEVPKLNDCIIEVSGDYVIVCVSEDSTSAKAIIDEYTK